MPRTQMLYAARGGISAWWVRVIALVVLLRGGGSWILPFSCLPRVWVACPLELQRPTPLCYSTPPNLSRSKASVDATKADLEGGTYSDVGSALRELCGERVSKFEDHHMALLHEAYYRSTAALRRATREGLNSAGLPPALIDIIITGQEGVCSVQPVCRMWCLVVYAGGGAGTDSGVPDQNEKMNQWVVVKPSLRAAPARVRRGDGPAAVCSVPELLESNTVFISDGFTPPIEDIPFTVFITPPRRSRYHQYRKSHSKMVYLPVYGREEILDLRHVCFPHLDVAGVEARFGRWGGIPRSVLLKAGADEQEDLESTIRSLRYGNALLLLDGGEPTTLATDKAVHIKVKGEFPGGPGPGDVAFYELHSHHFGSKYIKDVVFRSIPDHERRALRARIRSGTYIFRSQRVVAGHELEQELRLQLITGGQFTVRRVADGKVEVRTLPPLKERHFTSDGLSNVFMAGSDELYVSDDPNESPGDMIVGRGNMIIQGTLKREHSLVLTARDLGRPREKGQASAKPSKKTGLEVLVNSMGLLQGDIDIYWAVPDSEFDQYVPEVKYFRLGERVEEKTLLEDPLIGRIKHWVLKVDLGPDERDRGHSNQGT